MGSKKTILKRTTAYVLAFVMAFSLLFTGNNAVTASAAAKVTSIKAAKSKVTVEVGKSANVKVTVKGSNKKFTVKSKKKKIATVKVVGKNAVITGKKVGKTTITVTTKGKKNGKKLSKKIAVTVKAATTSTTEDQTKKNQEAANTVANLLNSLPASTSVTTNDQAKITEARKAYDALTPEQKALVPADVVKKLTDAEAALSQLVVTGVTVVVTPASINIGSSAQVSATVAPANAKTTLTYSVSNSAVAAIDQTGKVVGLTEGQTNVLVTAANGVVGSATLNVTAVKVTGITVPNATMEMTENEEKTVAYTVAPSDATDHSVRFTSSKTEVATVDETGKVKAIASGETTITITTNDGNYKAEVLVTVKADSKHDVDKEAGITGSVTNAINGYENTVLVGSRAKIEFSVKDPDGNLVGGTDTVTAELKNVSGYTNLYELSKEEIDINNGKGTVYVRLKSAVADNYSPIFSNNRPAFASFKVKLTAGGAGATKEIPVSFAQVQASTLYSNAAVAVDNEYDEDLTPIANLRCSEAIGTSLNKEKYNQEYVIDQEVSLDNDEHTVYLDAAPLLIRSATSDAVEKGDFYSDKRMEKSEYSIYQNEDNADIIKNVPGGLEYLSLNCEKLKLSEYTRIVIRAYEMGTNEPITRYNPQTDKLELVQKIVTSETGDTNSSSTIQIGEEIFSDATSNFKYIDLKIFIESAGQVNEDNNVGYIITSAKGSFENEELLKHDDEVMPDAVTWSISRANEYTTSTTLDSVKDENGNTNSAQAYLGKFYNSNLDYKVRMPAFPDTGNAIITAYKKGTEQVDKYYMYPTTTVNNNTVLRACNSSLTFVASTEGVVELTSGKYTAVRQADGRYAINSTKAGYVHVKAKISVGSLVESDDDALTYDLSSYVSFQAAPTDNSTLAQDTYAVAGQTVTLVATVKDSRNNIAQDVPVNWLNTDVDALQTSTKQNITQSDGTATLVLQSADAYDLNSVGVQLATAGQYTISLSIGGEAITSGIANIHWVKPGLYYRDTALDNGKDYTTADKKTNSITVDPASRYIINKDWIVGFKSVGLTAKQVPYYNIINDEDADEDEVEDAKEQLATIESVVDISNIAIGISPEAIDDKSFGNWFTYPEPKTSGVCHVKSLVTGRTQLTSKINGLADSSKKCVITIQNPDGTLSKYTSVGDGTVTSTANMVLPIVWMPDSMIIDLIIPNEVFDVNNNALARAYVYIHDSKGNPVSGEYSWSITSSSKDVVDKGNSETHADGYDSFTLTKPTINEEWVEDTYTVSVNLTNATDTKPVTGQVKYTNKGGSFNVTKVTPGVGTGIITVKFNSAVDDKFVKAHPEFFEVYTKEENGEKLTISSVERDSQDSTTVIITVNESQKTKTSESTVVNIKDRTDNAVGANYYFTNAEGILYTEGN